MLRLGDKLYMAPLNKPTVCYREKEDEEIPAHVCAQCDVKLIRANIESS